MNASLFWRILIAVIVAVIVVALLGPVSRLLGFPLDGDGMLVAKLCIAGIALFYIVTGKPS